MKKDNLVYVAKTKNHGKGLFAKKNIKKGKIVFTLKGPLLKKPTIYTIPIAPNSYLNDLEFGKYLNHSCNPNCGIKNKKEVVAMRNIKKGEEITIDYAMIIYKYGKEMTAKHRICKCGSDQCRGKLGAYSELSDKLKKKYKGFISDYLIDRKD